MTDPLAAALTTVHNQPRPPGRLYSVTIDGVNAALAAQGVYLVDAESLAAALLLTRWWAHGRSETENEWTTTELAAAILAALKVQP